jgi:hypothetical protein
VEGTWKQLGAKGGKGGSKGWNAGGRDKQNARLDAYLGSAKWNKHRPRQHARLEGVCGRASPNPRIAQYGAAALVDFGEMCVSAWAPGPRAVGGTAPRAGIA